MYKMFTVVDNVINSCTCIACPTQYEIYDKEGTEYYFRLRHGYARFDCEDTDEILASGVMEGKDGSCTFEDIRNWLSGEGITLLNDENGKKAK